MSKKIYKIVIAALWTIALCMIAGCGKNGEQEVSIDSEKLVSDLIDSGIFSSEIKRIDDSVASYMIGASHNTKLTLYMANGNKADEILILECENEQDAKSNESAVTEYLESVEKSFRDYEPEEYAKAENALLMQSGKYVILCISTDTDMARAVITRHISSDTAQTVSGEKETGQIPAVTEGSGESSAADTTAETEDSSQPTEENTTQEKTQEASSEPDTTQTAQETDSETGSEIKGAFTDYGEIVVIGNQGYEVYNYVEDRAERYASIVNGAAESLTGYANVYEMIVPIGSGMIFPEDYQNKVKLSDQKEAIAKFQEKAGEKVMFIDPYDAIWQHRNEYVFFRTDHHWTALGAYYAYTAFCQTKGITANPLEEYETVQFDGFSGSFASDTGNPELLAAPDYVAAYYPKCGNPAIHVTKTDGTKFDWDLIHDVTTFSERYKYNTFIGGDNAFTVISNPGITDGSSCLVVKESFGNAFVPFLTDHYQTVYVVDYRYWTGSVCAYVKEQKIQDVLFLNNISMTRNSYLIGQLAQAAG